MGLTLPHIHLPIGNIKYLFSLYRLIPVTINKSLNSKKDISSASFQIKRFAKLRYEHFGGL
jgi:hypothetical protein